jgi:hypothetical protein
MLALFLLAQLAQAAPESTWATDQTQHFTIHHESPGSAPGDDNRVERIYEALHPTLWPLVPWMTSTKIDVYLYGSRDAFLKGRFNPPPWSGGLMSDAQGEKSLAVYAPMDTSVAAHELTHLYLHTYFDEKSVSPPPWLDEGLAVLMQSEALSLPDPGDKGPVLPSTIPMKQFLLSRPAQDTPSAVVGLWYQQAHSVVRFLRRAHIESSFTTFCEKLRDGVDAPTALREVYGYEDVDAFEAAWNKWRPKKTRGQPLGLGEQ